MKKEKSELEWRCEWYPNIWPLYPASEEDIKLAKADKDFTHIFQYHPKRKNIFTVNYELEWVYNTIKVNREEFNKKLNEIWHKWWTIDGVL